MVKERGYLEAEGYSMNDFDAMYADSIAAEIAVRDKINSDPNPDLYTYSVMLLTFYVRGYEDLQYYHNLSNGNYDFLMTSDQEPVLNEETINRSNTTRLEMEKSYIYSFDSVFNRTLYSYDSFAPILLKMNY
ncbi:MAG: hypothetical protein Q4C00_03120 [Bacillota bacterium]|nr:hypothetical protein [Bacillota bacterium]